MAGYPWRRQDIARLCALKEAYPHVTWRVIREMFNEQLAEELQRSEASIRLEWKRIIRLVSMPACQSMVT